MIEVNKDEIIEMGFFTPFDDSKAELLESLYALIIFIHKEPLCLNYELFIQEDGSVISMGRWKDGRGFNFHKNMQYIETFITKKLPILCQTFDYKQSKSVVAPLTALSLLNEK